MKFKKGKLISFEGLDGSGKSSIIKLVYEKLVEENFKIEITREPGGKNALCEKIRDLLLNDKYEVCYEAEALLFAASRAQHVSKYILPKINSGVSVIVDRFIDSSLAFQGYGRKLSFEKILNINEFGIGKLKPDLTIFFDIPMELGIERIFNKRTKEINKLDKDSIKIQTLIHEGYQDIIKKFQDRFIVIDGTLSIEEVFEKTFKIIKDFIKND